METSLEINPKLPGRQTNIFTQMNRLVQEHNALNMAQGFPDFSVDSHLAKLVNDAMKKGYNQYAPMPGLFELREKIAEKISKDYSANYNPETEITVVPGATLGIYAAITSTVREGDEVIVIEPAYDCYVPGIKLNGAEPVYLELLYPDYKIDWEQFKKLINYKTKMVIINTPHNPSSTIFEENDLLQLQKILEGTGIMVLSDEVYEHIVFDGNVHQSVAKFEELAKRSFIVSSFGKSFHTTGWKMGYVVAPEKMTAAFRKVYQYMAFSANTPIQYAFAQVLNTKDLFIELSSFYEQKRNLFIDAIKTSKFTPITSQGSYFQLLNFEKISEESDVEFAKKMVSDYGIASIPLSPFYRMKTDHKVLRFCFAKKDETLLKAAELLCKI